MGVTRQQWQRVAAALGDGGPTILAVVAIYAAIVIVPIYLKSYQFERAARREAVLAAVNLTPADTIQQDLHKKAEALGLRVEPREIQVKSVVRQAPADALNVLVDSTAEPNKTAIVSIEVQYAVPLHFPGYTMDLNFHVHADNGSY
jgi:hypothetical protein